MTRNAIMSHSCSNVAFCRFILRQIEYGDFSRPVTSISSPVSFKSSFSRAMMRPTKDFTETTVDLSVFDLKHLTAIMAELRAKPAVNKVERVTG